MNTEIERLKSDGFMGFVSVAELRNSCAIIPDEMGVYVVLRLSDEHPHFLAKGTGGFFKGQDPNVPIATLQSKWVEGSHIMYIGKAGDPGKSATLRSRLKQYIRFGEGRNIGHQGGCYIWQLEDAADLVFAWKPLLDEHPSAEESRMIEEYMSAHNNMFPFANRRK